MAITSKSTAAYIAGFIDGEGTIAIKKTLIKNSLCYDINLSISNTDKPIIEWLYNSYGGTFHGYDKNPNKWKPIYRWTLYRSHHLLEFLRKVKPYLRIKRRQAEIVIEMDKLLGYKHKKYVRNSRGHIIRQEVDSDILSKREKLYQEIKLLNHRGSLHAERLIEVTREDEI